MYTSWWSVFITSFVLLCLALLAGFDKLNSEHEALKAEHSLLQTESLAHSVQVTALSSELVGANAKLTALENTAKELRKDVDSAVAAALAAVQSHHPEIDLSPIQEGYLCSSPSRIDELCAAKDQLAERFVDHVFYDRSSSSSEEDQPAP